MLLKKVRGSKEVSPEHSSRGLAREEEGSLFSPTMKKYQEKPRFGGLPSCSSSALALLSCRRLLVLILSLPAGQLCHLQRDESEPGQVSGAQEG